MRIFFWLGLSYLAGTVASVSLDSYLSANPQGTSTPTARTENPPTTISPGM